MEFRGFSAQDVHPLSESDTTSGVADPDAQPVWRDSSMDLEKGLDVFELDFDLVLPPQPLPLERSAN